MNSLEKQIFTFLDDEEIYTNPEGVSFEMSADQSVHVSAPIIHEEDEHIILEVSAEYKSISHLIAAFHIQTFSQIHSIKPQDIYDRFDIGDTEVCCHAHNKVYFFQKHESRICITDLNGTITFCNESLQEPKDFVKYTLKLVFND